MQKIKQKLNSKRGVSIVMALLLALVCLFAGAAALTAASANIGRYSHLRKDNQEYLSISSAAKLLSEQFAEDGTKISANCAGGAAVITIDPSLTNGHVYKLLNNWMSDLLWHCYNKSLSTGGDPLAAKPDDINFTVTVEKKEMGTTVVNENFKSVNVTVKAKELEAASVNIEVELTTGDRTLKFPVTLKFAVDETTSTITITESKVERITLPGKLEGTP